MEPTREPYADRDAAGRVLANLLVSRFSDQEDALVLGLPRGGVPVAAQVALAVRGTLDVLVVRKLGLPWNPELAMGAIAGVDDTVEVVRNEVVLARAAVSQQAFDDEQHRQTMELRRRETAYRQGRPAARIHGRTVIVVDDGLATGSTMRAAVAAVRRHHPSRLVAAVPAGSRRTCSELETELDEVICAWTPEPFVAVGQAYRNFAPTGDDEVRRLLSGATATESPTTE